MIPRDPEDTKQNCPVFSTPCRTFWPCLKPLELYNVFNFIVHHPSVITQKTLLKSIPEKRHMIDQLSHCINLLKWLQKNYIRN